jgi:uncharacterized protein YjbI with pentapeptide repeats
MDKRYIVALFRDDIMPIRALRSSWILVLSLGLIGVAAHAADLSVRDLTQRLYQADPGKPIDISFHDLRNLDLSGLDFKGAKMQGSNLFGADLRGADLSNADLRDAHLDRVIIIGARFDAANLAGASMLRPSAFSSMTAQRTEAVSFAGADMHGARIFARLNGANLSKANLSGATFAPFGRTGFIEHIWRTELQGADMSETDLAGADLTHALLAFADLRGAKLKGAILKKADLSRADLTGADLTGADLSEADLDGAILVDVRGLDTVQGLASALNVEKMIR